jgi:hypothetical protein
VLRTKPEKYELNREQTHRNQEQNTIGKSPLRRCSLWATFNVPNNPPDGQQRETTKQ